MNEELKVIISANTEKLQTEVEKAKKEIKGFGDVSEEQMAAFDEHLGNAKQTCANAMKAIGAAIAGAIASMVALAESTREFRNNQAKLKTAFESAGASAEDAAKTYDALYRVLGDDGQATEAAQHLAKLTNNQEELAEWTDICQGVYAEFGDSLPIEGLTEAVNHTAKLGEVQGSLADALEWSGINVDDFNDELAKCNDEAEREKKIRETLNKIYKTSATNYERNNKAVLEANDAQNRLNKSLAKVGGYMEPVNAELKSLGATLMEDLEEPLKDVAKWLTNKFFPALKDGYEWIKNNLPTISSVMAGLTVAVVGYKAATVAAKFAEQGLTAAIILRTAAQKALNAAMSANPIGLVITAVAALTAGLVAYGTQAQYAALGVDVLTKEEKELQERAEEVAEAFRQQREATDEAAGGILSSYEHTRKLSEELLGLADASGRVKAADETRVQFILNELNEALGTEYTMVDGVIQKYGDLEKSIYDVINAKTANALLEAHNQAYLDAIENERVAFGGMLVAQKDYEAQLAKTSEAEQRYLEAFQEWEAAVEEGNHYVIEATRTQMDTALWTWGEEQKILDEKKSKYDEATLTYGQHYATIEEYEEAAMLIQQGNYEDAITMLKNKGDAFFEYSDDVNEATRQAIDSLFKEAVDAGIEAARTKKNFEDGIEGYTEEMVAEAEKAYEDALDEWATAYDDANGVGEDLGSGLEDGMEDKRGGLLSKARSLVSGIISAMRKEADSHSPSRKTIAFGEDLGEGAEIGVGNSTKDVINASKNMVSESLKAIQGISATDFSRVIGNTVLKAHPMATSNRAIAGPETNSLLNALGTKISADTPIILQVDGKTFAQTAINTINQQTRQTGKLTLNVM